MSDTQDVRIRALRRQWPDLELHEDLWQAAGVARAEWYVQRGAYLVPRRAHAVFHGAQGIPDVELVVESDGPSWLDDSADPDQGGVSWVSAVHITADGPGGITGTRIASIDLDYLMHAALAHAGYTRRTPNDERDDSTAVAISQAGYWEGNTGESVLDAFHPIRNKTRKPAKVTAEFLAEVAELYLREVDAGNRAPVDAIAKTYGKAHRTAAGWLMKARDLGILAEGGRKGRTP